MGNEQIKAQVREALKVQWEEFAANHPALARAMDQEMLTETCMRDLREDAEFREAMDLVSTAPLFAPVVEATVVRLVKAWLGRL
jgi:hypothetical protein